MKLLMEMEGLVY